MSATVSTDFLLRVAQATPEQQAAIERVLRGGILQKETEETERGRAEERHEACGGERLLDAVLRVEQKVDAVRAAVAGRAEVEAQVTEGEARRVFVLMKRLEGAPKQRKAAMAAVFRLLVLQGLSQRATAARCGCAESLISIRVADIEKAFGMSVGRLRNFASELLSLESAAKGQRARKKKFGRPDDFERPEGVESDDEAGEEPEEQTGQEDREER